MGLVKSSVRRALNFVGYDIVPSSRALVRYENFENIVGAYEERLIRSGFSIPANDSRAKLLGRLLGTPPTEAYFIIDALAKSSTLAGDICEFGVAQGETSAFIANELASLGSKRLHLFDSFEGLPQPSRWDELKDDVSRLGSIEAYAGTMACPEEMVRDRLSSIGFPADRAVIHKGFVEEVFARSEKLPSEVCFAYVDLDFYEPIKATLNFLSRVTCRGAMVIVDDYDFFSTGAKRAVDEFIRDAADTPTPFRCEIPDDKVGHFAVLTRAEA